MRTLTMSLRPKGPAKFLVELVVAEVSETHTQGSHDAIPGHAVLYSAGLRNLHPGSSASPGLSQGRRWRAKGEAAGDIAQEARDDSSSSRATLRSANAASTCSASPLEVPTCSDSGYDTGRRGPHDLRAVCLDRAMTLPVNQPVSRLATGASSQNICERA